MTSPPITGASKLAIAVIGALMIASLTVPQRPDHQSHRVAPPAGWRCLFPEYGLTCAMPMPNGDVLMLTEVYRG